MAVRVSQGSFMLALTWACAALFWLQFKCRLTPHPFLGAGEAQTPWLPPSTRSGDQGRGSAGLPGPSAVSWLLSSKALQAEW